MKYKGAVCDFIAERNADLLRAYKQIIEVRDNVSLSEIIQQLEQSPSRRFWVSEMRAYQVILHLLKGKSINHMIPTRVAMFQEIFRRFNLYREQFPSLTKKEIIWRICNEPAPSFYLTRKSLVNILEKVRKEEKRRCYELRKSRLRFMLGTL